MKILTWPQCLYFTFYACMVSFFKIYYHTRFHNPAFSGASVTPALSVCHVVVIDCGKLKCMRFQWTPVAQRSYQILWN